MGVFTYPVEIAAADGARFERFDAVVDSGAFYSQLPAATLHRLGVVPIDRAVFMTADGRRFESELGEVRLRIDGRERGSICVFAEEDAPPILGAYALEGFMLAVDAVHGRLVPIEGALR